MQDAEVPTEPEDGANDPPRRANLRLRDAEAVATVRRDMFGDGSLLDSLASAPPPPEGAETPPDAAHPPAEFPAPESDAAEGRGDAPEALGSPAYEAQSLDAIIDSFPAEPEDGASQQPGDAAPPAAATPPMGISSLFDSLGGAGETQPVEEPTPPGAPPLHLDMSMLELRVPTRPALVPQSDPPAIAPNGTPPVSAEPAAQAPEADTDAGQAGDGPDLDMSMLERSLARPVLQAEPDSDRAAAGAPYGESSHASDSEMETNEPRAAEPAFAGAADAPAGSAMPTPGAGEPPLADPGDPSTFSGSMAPPPYSERADAAGRLHDFVEPAEPASPPPFLEPLVMYAEPSEPVSAPPYAEPLAGPSFRGIVEPANDRGFPEPQEGPAYAESAEAAQPMFDAAAKIAAEAEATAEALDNLKRLLGHSAPDPLQDPLQDSLQPPAHTAGTARLRLDLRGDPAPFRSSGPAALMPMPLPVPPERSRIRSIYALGFLTGLGLSLMAGIALYILINLV